MQGRARLATQREDAARIRGIVMSSIININFNEATINETQFSIEVEAATFVMSEEATFTFSGAGFDPLPNGILGINGRRRRG
jgi:hypothetical protein